MLSSAQAHQRQGRAETSPTASCRKPCPGFSEDERQILLATRGIGGGVIERIECAGVHSLQQLRQLGVDAIVDRICQGTGNFAWRNRKRALLRALATVATPASVRTAVSD